VAERFGQRPSDLLRGSLPALLFDAHVASLLAREEKKALRRAKRK
jgi:hypothetical protein